MILLAAVLGLGVGRIAHGEKANVKVLFSKRLSANGSTRATAYAMSNKIITAKGKTFVAWLDLVADVRMATYDIAKRQWSDTELVGQGTDNHSGPAITMDSEGYLYIAYGPHVGPFQFRKSERPCDVTAWEPVQRFGVNATYPSLVCGPDDTLHCTYRGGKRPLRVMYQRKPKDGKWSRPREVVHSAAPGGYTQYGNALAVAKDGTLHLAFHIYDMHPAAGKAAGYLRSRDGGGTWETADGREVKLPATPKTKCFVEQGPKLDVRIGNVVLDGAGRPWITVIHLEPGARTALLWHREGARWRPVDLLPFVRKRLGRLAIGQAAATFDRGGTLYVAAAVLKPGVSKAFGHPSKEVVLLTSVDRGRTFRAVPISTPDPKLPNWLPSIERPYGPRPVGVPSFIYTHGNIGTYGDCKSGKPTEVFFVRLTK